MSPSKHTSEPARIFGIDLAWGERNPDGLCLLETHATGGVITSLTRTHGDPSLLQFTRCRPEGYPCLLAIDAPLICKNPTGARPVDIQTHRVFGRFKCGCYPVNLGLCTRPMRLATFLRQEGFECGWGIPTWDTSVMMEVYPHTSLVRRFALAERIPYKKGKVALRRLAFARLQAYLLEWLESDGIHLPPSLEGPLRQPWSKANEDMADALVCARTGYHHWKHQGRASEVLGDLENGFLVTLKD